jgi:hypothetical protein
MATNSQCTVTLQDEVDILQTFADLEPVLNVGGNTSRVILTAANNVMNAICAVQFPWKWNEFNLPYIYTNTLQQDYALVNPNGTSVTNLAWLERGLVIDINNSAEPKPWRPIETGRQLTQSTGTMFNSSMMSSPAYLVSWMLNNQLYYGTWGGPNNGTSSIGNNPYPGAVYTSPLGTTVLAAVWSSVAGGQITFNLSSIPGTLTVGSALVVSQAYPVTYNNTYSVTAIFGNSVTVSATPNPGTYESGGVIGNTATSSMPNNPVLQIRDANGNYLVLTGFGQEGTAAPLAPINAAYGTQVSGVGASTVWTVVDPFGQGLRLLPVPAQSGSVWQFNIVGQMKPVRFTNVNQTLAPLWDEFEPHFQMGLIAQLYRFSPQKAVYSKFEPAWQHWLKSLQEFRSKEDREMEENTFVPDRGILGGAPGRNRFLGPQWPYNYPTR